jgi:hypothetical protein
MVVMDIFAHLDEKDRAYFRWTRDDRLLSAFDSFARKAFGYPVGPRCKTMP